MSDGLFDYEEKPTSCAYCGRRLEQGKCPWCDRPIAATPARVMARRSDPSTSKRAAEKARYRTGTHKALIIEAHGRHPEGLTDEESAPASGLTYHQAERRCCDLRNEGMLTILKDENGREVERPGTSGSAMRVSVLTDLGFATLRTMKEPDAHRPDPVPVPTHHHVGPTSADCPACDRQQYQRDKHTEWPGGDE